MKERLTTAKGSIEPLTQQPHVPRDDLPGGVGFKGERRLPEAVVDDKAVEKSKVAETWVRPVIPDRTNTVGRQGIRQFKEPSHPHRREVLSTHEWIVIHACVGLALVRKDYWIGGNGGSGKGPHENQGRRGRDGRESAVHMRSPTWGVRTTLRGRRRPRYQLRVRSG